MKKLFLFLTACLACASAYAQCNVNNATSCQCADPAQTNCDLLPDITISWYGITDYMGGPSEYGQTGNGANNGRLRITGSTPNIGRGSFTVRGVDDQGYRWFVCGTDTVSLYDPNSILPFICPNTGDVARQLLLQRVYHKNGNAMTYTDRFTGTMTFHPTHGHNHVDDWATFTLRLQDPSEPNPRNWPIIGEGAKVGFCLMDYGTCAYYNGHCRDNNTVYNQGTALNQASQFPNYGLGGGSYNCSPIEQGISVGYTDIYSEALDGMWINVPPGTCNGNYWIVAEVDPNNDFHESDETNNFTAVPFTLTQQVSSGTPPAISSNQTAICSGSAVSLTAPAGTSYSWSNGATSSQISVSTPGNYTVTVTNNCGTQTSLPFTLSQATAPAAPLAQPDSVCVGNSATLTASAGNNLIQWYSNGGQLLHTGNSFTTPALTATSNFQVRAVSFEVDSALVGPTSNTFGSGGFISSNQGLTFDAFAPFTLRSVKVYAQGSGQRTIMLLSSTGAVLAQTTATVPDGESRVMLNFSVPAGTGLRLSTSNANLYRNSGGVVYPYTVANFVSITGSTAGGQYYYFFYDWDVYRQTPLCSSNPVMVQAVAMSPASVTFAGLASQYYNNSAPVALTGSPTGGTFTGPGISGNIFDPAAAGQGSHNITYTHTNIYGCQVSHTMQTAVSQFVGLAEDFDYQQAISVFPNPSNGVFTFQVRVPGQTKVSLSVQDLLGRMVKSYAPVEVQQEYSVEVQATELPAGTYLLRATIGGSDYFRKVVIK